MNIMRNNLGVLCLSILLGFSIRVGTAGAQSGFHLDLEPERVSWSRLSFHAKNFWVEVSTDIQFVQRPAAEIEGLLIQSPRGTPVKPANPRASQITINTVIDPSFRSPINIFNRIWFNPRNAAALGRIRLRRGEDDFKKIYRFTDQGVFRHRLEPGDKSEVKLEPEKWTDIKDSFYPHDLAQLGCNIATERSLLIYIISAAQLSEINNATSLCVFGKRQLHRVKLQQEGTHSIKVNFAIRKRQNELKKEERINAVKITLTTEPLESELNEAENFSFLGFHKDISIYIDPASGIPIRASGIIPSAGQAELNLTRVWLKD